MSEEWPYPEETDEGSEGRPSDDDEDEGGAYEGRRYMRGVLGISRDCQEDRHADCNDDIYDDYDRTHYNCVCRCHVKK